MIAVVRVLPAKSESSVVDSHDEDDLRLQGVSLIMCENLLNVSKLFVDGGCRYTMKARI